MTIFIQAENGIRARPFLGYLSTPDNQNNVF